jgi:hypothetical protein
MREYSYTLIEHDPSKPWIIVAREPRSVQLADSHNFFDWAKAQWPVDRYTVELDPWQLSPS